MLKAKSTLLLQYFHMCHPMWRWYIGDRPEEGQVLHANYLWDSAADFRSQKSRGYVQMCMWDCFLSLHPQFVWT